MGSAENKTAAYGLFRMEVRLDEVVTSLNSAGFESTDICVFLPPGHPIVEGVRNMKAAATAFEMEASPERMVSWLATFGGIVIPDLGCFVGSPEYLRALMHTNRLPDVAGNHGMLASLGIPLRHAARVRRDASLVFCQLRWFGAVRMGTGNSAALASGGSALAGRIGRVRNRNSPLKLNEERNNQDYCRSRSR